MYIYMCVFYNLISYILDTHILLVAMIRLFSFTAFFICLNGFKMMTNGELIMTVDPLGQSGASSIQAAIDAVPSDNDNWITIQVKAGVYNEQVKIPLEKPFIYLKGEGIGKSIIVWGANSLNSPTFESMADNIMVSGITFQNSYNYPPEKTKNVVKQAVAAKISGDKSAFYGCSFLGYQDTLWDDNGRHYFVGCIIEGAIDFIFGNGQSIYQNCKILVNIESLQPDFVGYITAQGRGSPSGDSGFVFKGCTVTGNGRVMLGRAWMRYSRVIFYDSYLSNLIVPTGWFAWKFQGREGTITYSEVQCRGPGSNKSNRVKWVKTLSKNELYSYISTSYIDDEGWISKLPYNRN